MGLVAAPDLSKLHGVVATQEAHLKQMMENVKESWATAILPIEEWNDTGVRVLGDLSEITSALEASHISIQTVLDSRYAHTIRDEV